MFYYLKIASLIIKVDLPLNLLLIDEWQRLFGETLSSFLTVPQTPNFTVKLYSNKSLRYPRLVGKTLFVDNLIHPAYFLKYLSIVLDKILKNRDLLIFHASGIINYNRALLFCGSSGAGKTTTLHKLDSDFPVLGDDAVIIGLEKNTPVAFPAPFNLKVRGRYARNQSYPIANLYFLKKNHPLHLQTLTSSQALPLLLNQLHSIINTKKSARFTLTVAQSLSSISSILSLNLKSNITKLIQQQND